MRHIFLFIFMAVVGSAVSSKDNFIILQSTTSPQNAGLYGAILPLFTEQTGIEVRVVAGGSGQALRQAADCNGEAVIVHDQKAEMAFLDAGFSTQRDEIMRNDYVMVGPQNDPAGIGVATTPIAAFSRIAVAQHPFVSRGDQSGTHSREMEIWAAGGRAPVGSWYRETGAGMGATLNIAVGMNAYTLTDYASWMNFGNKQQHRVHLRGHPLFINRYSIMLVNESHCPTLNTGEAQIFLDWILSNSGQGAIGAFSINGETVFQPAQSF